MPSALKGSGQELIHHLAGQTRTYNTAAHAQYIGVIVHAGGTGTEAIGAAGCPDALVLIGGNGDANAGAAEQQRKGALAAG